jgi:hypothetical protein
LVQRVVVVVELLLHQVVGVGVEEVAEERRRWVLRCC